MILHNAWDIFLHDNSFCIVVGFENDVTAKCAEWPYENNAWAVRQYARDIKPTFSIPITDVKNVVFNWT